MRKRVHRAENARAAEGYSTIPGIVVHRVPKRLVLT